MSAVVGIDLGTTNSVIAIHSLDEPEVLPNAEGNRTTPSVVAFPKGGGALVGELAKRQAVSNPARTFSSIKREMGTQWRSKSIDGVTYIPQEISARVLLKVVKDAERYLDTEIREAVVTVPAFFTDAQRQATKDAAAIAGLRVLRIISEPLAATLAYGFGRQGEQETILVVDLGGGTFDVSVIEISSEKAIVRSTDGDVNLGGNDWDQRISSWIVRRFQEAHGLSIWDDLVAMQRVREVAEQTKIDLSQLSIASIFIPYVAGTGSDSVHIEDSISRSEFEELTADLVERCKRPVERCLATAGITSQDLDHVVLVGGATRMPAIGDLVRELTGREPFQALNPDEAVALGAAIQAKRLSAATGDFETVEVTPLSLGIETNGGVMTRLIERNSRLPSTRTEIFTTAEDNQPNVEIHVLEGEDEFASGNTSLGKFQLYGIEPVARGVPQIEVTFEVDDDGIMQVSARDRSTGMVQSIEVSGTAPLSVSMLSKLGDAAQVQMASNAKNVSDPAEGDSGEANPLQPASNGVHSDQNESQPVDRLNGSLNDSPSGHSVVEVIHALMPIIDALSAAEKEAPNIVSPVLDALLVELSKFGLSRVAVDGKAFDPYLAEAVTHEPGDSGEIIVIETFRDGYLFNGRLLRPAMVRTKTSDV